MENQTELHVEQAAQSVFELSQHVRLKRNKIQIRKWTKARVTLRVVLALFILITMYTFLSMDYGEAVFSQAVAAFFKDLSRIFFQPTLSGRFSFLSLVKAMGVTLGLGALTTLLGGVFALFLSLLAARNLSNKTISNIVKMTLSFVRAVPTILWVLIFSVIVGLGASAAVIGMTFHSVAYLTKVYSESIEEMDGGIIEALSAAGASFWQIICQGVLPVNITALLSWTFLRFEINFTTAIAIGAAAGAGGIGFQLGMASGFYFDLHEIGVMVYMILFVAVLLELFATKLRGKFIVKH